MVNPFDFNGKKFLVVGAENEIGDSIIRQLQYCNAEVTAIATKNDNLLPAAYSIIDISKTETIEQFINVLGSKSGQFNGFVFCSGKGGVRPLSMTKPSFVTEMMNWNVNSFIELVRCLSKKKLIISGGSIVAISSVSSIKGMKSKTAYCASKAALDASIRCMAMELCDKKIRVNTIQKGWVSTDMKKEFIRNNMDLDETGDMKKQFLGIIEPEEIANIVAFLLCESSRNITGTSILLDGGYSL